MTGLISVEEALRRVLAGIEHPVAAEDIPVGACAGRTLALDLAAKRTQPPFANSAMDGFAVRAEDVLTTPATLRIVGESAAGRGYRGAALGPGEAVRIFTGAPLPAGADAVVIQENGDLSGAHVIVREGAERNRYVRPAGLDFREGEVLLRAGERLDACRLALAAAMGHPGLPVRRRPRVAILATGDELVRPGDPIGPDQIVASNTFALAALVERAGAEPVELAIAGDTPGDLARSVSAAKGASADLLVTLGGASVGAHDLVRTTLAAEGMDLGFWRVALRPGKPLLYGRLGAMFVLGLPGNPVSSIVCAILFVVPAIRALLGMPDAGRDPTEPAVLGADLKENDSRQDYLRARLEDGRRGGPEAFAFERQDSSMMNLLARSDALIRREPHAPAARAGEPCRILRLDRFS